MSVLIKGIQMPDNCSECQIEYDQMMCPIVGRWYEQSYLDIGFDPNKDRLPECPLVELPKHHGKLIDANRLMRAYEDRLEKVADRYGVDSSEAGILSGAMELLMIELGIVEAE